MDKTVALEIIKLVGVIVAVASASWMASQRAIKQYIDKLEREIVELKSEIISLKAEIISLKANKES